MINSAVTIFGIRFLLNKHSVSETIKSFAEEKKKGYICAVNANILVNAEKDKKYSEIIKNSLLNVCDGGILISVINFFKKSSFSSYPGPELFNDLIKENEFRHFLLGSDKATIDKLLGRLKESGTDTGKYGYYSPPVQTAEEFDYASIAKTVSEFQPDIIWVSLGAPKQEYFMNYLVNYLRSGILIGVGQAFALTASGSKSKMQTTFRKFKLEWLYRLIIEPGKTFGRLIKEIWYLPQIIVKEIMNR